MKRKTVVFGGSGFLGSHVVDALLGEGHDVLVFDQTPSPYVDPARMIVNDILCEPEVQRAVEGADAVYNFAGLADIDSASDRPLDTVRSNILGNCIILDACRQAGVKRFVFAS